MTISMEKKYRTRDGRDVRILCVDGHGDYPVVGIVIEGNSAFPSSWKEDGRYFSSDTTNMDLIEVRSAEDVVFETLRESRWAGRYCAEDIVTALREAGMLKEGV